MAALTDKTALGSSFSCSHEQQVHELQAKIASLEKEEAYKKGEDEQITKSKRNMIAEIIPRNLPQYRSDEDFDREVEYRANQINEYTTIEDLKGLYDAKLWKHAKGLMAKTASREASNNFNFIHNLQVLYNNTYLIIVVVNL